MGCRVVVGTLMREFGETGVQSHFNVFKGYLLERGVAVEVVTPFSFCSWFVLFVFGIRKIIDGFSGEFSVWWYRCWHYVFLKRVLADRTRGGGSVVIYAQCPLSAKAALETRCSEQQRVIMVVHFNGSQADEWVDKGKIKKGGWVYRGIKRVENEVLPLVDGIVYVSRFMEEVVKNTIPGVANVKSVVLPNFVVRPKQPDIRQVAGDLINIGTLERRKNQGYLLQVLAEAKKLGRRYSLTLIGDGPDRGKLEFLAQSLDVDEQVKFMGFQKNAAQFLSAHCVYVHSALIENSPTVLVEAMACSLPLLAGTVGGIPEVFSDGVEGFYWSLHNPAAAAQRLIALMEDVETRNRMAIAAQLRFSSNFDSNVVAGRLLSFLSADADETPCLGQRSPCLSITRNSQDSPRSVYKPRRDSDSSLSVDRPAL